MPTLFNRPSVIRTVVASLEKQMGPYDKLVIIANEESAEFMNWYTPHTKLVSGERYNIGKALNLALDLMDHDYFCFIHDDIIIRDDEWINKYIYTYNTHNVGQIGIIEHRTGVQKAFGECLWADGVFFVARDRIMKVGRFDEEYHGDCETADFAHRLIEAGWKNYVLMVDGHHRNQNFKDKQDGDLAFRDLVNASRKRYIDKWVKK